MADLIVLDLGDEYGEIAIAPIPTAEEEGLLEASSLGEAVETIKRTSKKLVQHYGGA